MEKTFAVERTVKLLQFLVLKYMFLFYSDVLPANMTTTHLTVLDENNQIISTIEHGKYIKLQIDAASITSGIIEVTFIRTLDSSGKIEVTFRLSGALDTKSIYWFSKVRALSTISILVLLSHGN